MFTKAITRKPCQSLINGISTGMFGEGRPDYAAALKQHEEYVAALRELGLDVTVLEADEKYPDSCFVEDTAVVMEKCAVISNPARDSRNGETIEMSGVIGRFYDASRIFRIEAPGTLEGGDVMRVGDHFYVGLSGRTNKEGAAQFNGIVSRFGYTSSTIPVTEGLHLKDFVIYLENNKMLVNAAMNEVPDFQQFDRYIVEPDELYAINSLNINGTVLVPEGFPRTLELIRRLGYPVRLLDTSEYSKIDGSLTCLSLRF